MAEATEVEAVVEEAPAEPVDDPEATPPEEPAGDPAEPPAEEVPAPVEETDPVVEEPVVTDPDPPVEEPAVPEGGLATYFSEEEPAPEPEVEDPLAGGLAAALAEDEVTIQDADGNPDVIYDVQCMQEEAGFGLNCTANDISIASVTNLVVTDDGCAYPGDTVTFTADFQVLLTADARHDVGLWFATDGDPNSDGALTGTCAAATPPYAPDPPWLDLDGTLDPYPGDNKPSGVQDTCGDIDNDHNPLYPSVTLTAVCVDADGNGLLDLPACTSWRQPGDNDLCTSPQDAVPGAPSKCKCDTGFNVPVKVPGQIIVDKVTSPAGLTTSFDFTLTGAPTGGDPITPVSFSLTDSSEPFESSYLYGGTYSIAETANPSYATTATCSDGSPANAVDLQPGEIVTCTFTNTLLTGTLIVEKNLINDNLGPKTCPDFSYTVDGNDAVAFEADCSNSQTALAGTHTVVEVGVPIDGYTTTYNNCENVSVPAGGSATCTITNDDIAVPGMTVEKSSSTTSLSAPATVTYDYVVTNTGNTTLTGITLSDNNDNDDLNCPTDTLAVGASMTCHATHTFTQAELDAGGTLDNTVTADSNETEPSTDSLTIPITQAPALTLLKTASPLTYDGVGDVISYSYLVTNSGNVTLTGPVTVADDKATVTCPEGGLAPLAWMTCTASYTITQADLDSGSVTNTAMASANSTNSNEDDETVIASQAPALSLDKTGAFDAGADGFADVGELITYSFVVTNIGNITLTNLTVTDPLVGLSPITCDATTIPVGGFVTCTATYAVTQADIDAGSVHNLATADSDESEPDDDTNTEPLPQNPALTLDKSGTFDAGADGFASVGELISYEFLVTNTGNVTLTGITVTDPKVDPISCPAVTLAVGESMTCTGTYAVTQADIDAGSVYNLATADSNESGPDDGDNNEPLPQNPALDITKVAAEKSFDAVGDVLTYTITATNIGNVTLSGVTVTDELVSGLDCTPANGSPLMPGDSMICTAIHTVTQADLEAGHWANTACVDDGPLGAPEVCDGEDVPGDKNPAIEVTKSANPGVVPETGSDVTFTYTVTNVGNVQVTITSLSDDVFGTLAGDADCMVGTVLGVGASCDFSVIKTVEGDFSGPDHVNVFTAVAEDNDGTDATDDDDATVDFTDVPPTILVTKTANPTAVPETGGDVLFTFTVQNTSTEEPVTILSLVDDVYETLAGDADCMVGTVLAASASCEFSFTKWVEGDYTGPDHVNLFTAVAEDNDGTDATDDDYATVDFTDVAPTISVAKTAAYNSITPAVVPETGSNVTFTFVVTNTGPEDVTLTSLTDTVFGDLDGKGTCDVPQTILADGNYTCSYTVFLASDSLAAHYNVTTATAVDDDGTQATDDDDETVTFTDVAPAIQITKTASPTSVPETGGDVTFTFLVENTGQEDVTLTSLSDTVFGDLDGKGTCEVPQTILIGGSYSCEYTVNLASDSLTAHYNVTTATAVDDDNTPATDDDDETVTFTDVAPAIRVTKTANPTSVPETGGDVTFTFLVENIGQEDVTLTSLTDSVFGDLSGQGDCVTGGLIPVDGSYTCSITKFLSSDSLTAHTNVVTAVGTDDDGTTDTATDDETVTFTDVAPAIEVTKTADPNSVPEMGGLVTFTFLVENTGVEDVTLTSLVDTQFLELDGQGTCVLPQIILIGGSYSCEYTVFMSSDSLIDHYNVVTAHAVDDDGTAASDTDDETVTFTDVLPDIAIVKTADPTSVPETGGNVEFTVVVTNNSLEDATIDSLTDTDFDLGVNCPDAVGTILGHLDTYTCTFTEFIAGDYGVDHVNTATVVASDDDGNTDSAWDDETVVFTDVLPDIAIVKTADPTSVPETGGDVEFTIVVTNNSLEDATIDSLVDSDFDLSARCPAGMVGTVLGSGESYTCTFTEWVEGDYSGPDHVNTATVVVSDGDGNTDTASDDATVDFTNVLPTILVTKTADPTAVPETGQNVTFTFTVKNTSSEEPVIITSLVDSVYGTLAGDADCAVGTVLAADASCTFSITEWVEGEYSGPDHLNAFTAHAEDNDGTAASDTDDETVTFTDVLPDIAIVKTADPTSVPETGGNVEFTVVVTNNSLEDATIDSLTDTDFDLGVNCPDAVGTILGHLDTYTCTFTEFIAGDYESGISHENTATVVASDDDGNSDTASDDATVSFTDVDPAIDVEKYVSVDGGTTWLDADDPTGPFATEGDALQFKFVVTNYSPVTLSSISLTDSDFSLAGCTIPATLAAGASFECTITTTAVMGQHTDTATAAGSLTDGAGVVETDTDTDDANYYGMMKGQPSIQIESLSIMLDGLTRTYGEFRITDQSTSAKTPDGFLVALLDYGVRWDQKAATKKAVFQAITPDDYSCTYTIVSSDYDNVGWTQGDPIIFDEEVIIGYSCTFDSGILLKGATLKGTAYAGIFGRTGMEFTYSSTIAIPKK